MHFSLICLVIIVVLCSQAVNAKTIARLQYRVNDQGSKSVTQSVFHSFGNDYYLLQTYDHEYENETDQINERYEFYLGSAIKLDGSTSPYGVVTRVQRWTNFDLIAAAGFELNFNRMSILTGLLKKKIRVLLFSSM